MKHFITLPIIGLFMAGCAQLPAPASCGGVAEIAPIVLTKEGFPIIDDQAALPVPCDVVVVNPPVDEPPVDEPPVDEPPKGKCNSGRGNGSEGSPDCDPGNSGRRNNGGD